MVALARLALARVSKRAAGVPQQELRPPPLSAAKAMGSLVPCQGQVHPKCDEHAPAKHSKREAEAF